LVEQFFLNPSDDKQTNKQTPMKHNLLGGSNKYRTARQTCPRAAMK